MLIHSLTLENVKCYPQATIQIQPRHEHDRWPQRIGQDNYP